MIRRFWVFVNGRYRGELAEFDGPDAFSLARARAVGEVGTTSAAVEVIEVIRQTIFSGGA